MGKAVTAFVIALASAGLLACAQRPQQSYSGASTYSPPVYSPASPPSPPPAPKVVGVEDSQFDKSAKFTGIDESTPGYPLNTKWLIRSFVDKNTRRTTHQLYVLDAYQSNSWRFWNGGSDDRANSLSFTAIDRKVVTCNSGARGSCYYMEQFGLDLPDDVLRSRADTGFQVKIRSKAGDDKVITVSSEQIKLQLTAIDDHFPPSSGKIPVGAGTSGASKKAAKQ